MDWVVLDVDADRLQNEQREKGLSGPPHEDLVFNGCHERLKREYLMITVPEPVADSRVLQTLLAVRLGRGERGSFGVEGAYRLHFELRSVLSSVGYLLLDFNVRSKFHSMCDSY